LCATRLRPFRQFRQIAFNRDPGLSGEGKSHHPLLHPGRRHQPLSWREASKLIDPYQGADFASYFCLPNALHAQTARVKPKRARARETPVAMAFSIVKTRAFRKSFSRHIHRLQRHRIRRTGIPPGLKVKRRECHRQTPANRNPLQTLPCGKGKSVHVGNPKTESRSRLLFLLQTINQVRTYQVRQKSPALPVCK